MAAGLGFPGVQKPTHRDRITTATAVHLAPSGSGGGGCGEGVTVLSPPLYTGSPRRPREGVQLGRCSS